MRFFAFFGFAISPLRFPVLFAFPENPAFPATINLPSVTAPADSNKNLTEAATNPFDQQTEPPVLQKTGSCCIWQRLVCGFRLCGILFMSPRLQLRAFYMVILRKSGSGKKDRRNRIKSKKKSIFDLFPKDRRKRTRSKENPFSICSRKTEGKEQNPKKIHFRFSCFLEWGTFYWPKWYTFKTAKMVYF